MTEIPDEILKYKVELEKLLLKSQEFFEARLTYISGGGLALSMTFIKETGNHSGAIPKYECLLILGWCFLALTLIFNFISHYISSKIIYKTIDEINKLIYNHKKINKKFYFVSIINIITMIMLILGIISIISYAILNI